MFQNAWGVKKREREVDQRNHLRGGKPHCKHREKATKDTGHSWDQDDQMQMQMETTSKVKILMRRRTV